jgi:hypothetical protein
MIVMRGGVPRWCCDLCYSELLVEPLVLFSAPQAKTHFPAPLLACSKTCEGLAESRLTAGGLRRLSWATFLRALNDSEIGASR